MVSNSSFEIGSPTTVKTNSFLFGDESPHKIQGHLSRHVALLLFENSCFGYKRIIGDRKHILLDIGYPPKICFHELDKLTILSPCLPHFLLRYLFVNLFQRVFDRYTCQCFRKIPWSSHYLILSNYGLD